VALRYNSDASARGRRPSGRSRRVAVAGGPMMTDPGHMAIARQSCPRWPYPAPGHTPRLVVATVMAAGRGRAVATAIVRGMATASRLTGVPPGQAGPQPGTHTVAR
jgi:hypothetical protein